jgi:hypothetical protein
VYGWTWAYVETELQLGREVRAIRRHLRQHPPDFVFREAEVGFKPPPVPVSRIKSVKAVRPISAINPDFKRTPSEPWTPEEAALFEKLRPGFLARRSS